MFKKSILKLGIPSLLFALAIAILSVVTGGSVANADVPSSHDPNARGSWVNAYYIDYDGQRFVDSNPNDGNHTYIYTSPGSNPCTSDIKFDGDPIWQNGDAQNAKVTVRSPAASGGCEQKSTEAPAGFNNTGNREIFFFTDTDGNIKHVNKSGLIFKKQSGYWYNPADGDGSDAGGNPCRDIITGETLISVQPVEKNTVQANQYERFYQAIGKTPPASGLVCASTLGAIKVAETYSINTNIPPSEITGAGGMLRLHIGPASSATGPNVGQAAPEDKDPNSNNPGDNPPTCEAGALGWIICAVVNFMSGVNDIMFSLIETRLYIDPVKVETNGPLYNVWAAFRNIANIAFVIAFLVVIFSQATSIGLSSYGIKKMLPRIIITAILVNLSFFICQIALDFSNVIGGSIGTVVNNILSGMDRTIDIHETGWSAFVAWIIAGGAAVGTFAVILGSGGIAAAISLLLPFLITALFAVLTALVVIIAREAIVILLIAISPIAFVAYILPNTEKYFEKWRSLAVTMLLLYPFVALLFAGCKLAAAIILGPGDGSGFGSDPLVALTALVVMFVPLFGVPFIVRFSGNVLGRIAGAVNNPNRGPFDALKKQAERTSKTARDRAQARNASGNFGKGFVGAMRRNTFGRAYQFKANREGKEESAAYEAKRADTEYKSNKLMNDEKYAAKAAGGDFVLGKAADDNISRQTAIARTRAQGLGRLNALRGEERKAGRELLEEMGLNIDDWVKLQATGRTTYTDVNGKTQEVGGDFYQSAALTKVIPMVHPKGMGDLFKNSGKVDPATGKKIRSEFIREIATGTLQDTYSTIKAKSHTYNNVDLQQKLRRDEEITLDDYQKASVAQLSGLTKDVFSGQTDKDIRWAIGRIEAIRNGSARAEPGEIGKIEKLIATAQQAVADNNIRKNFTTESFTLAQQLASSTPPTPGPTQNNGTGNNVTITTPPAPVGPPPTAGSAPPTTWEGAARPGPMPTSGPSTTTQNVNQTNTTTNYNTTNVSSEPPRPTTGGFQGDMQIPRSPASPGTPPSNNPPTPPEDSGGIRLPPRLPPDSPPDDERP